MILYIDTRPTLEWVEHICKDDVSILHRAQSGILVYEITDDHNGEYSMSVWAEDNGDTFMLAEDVKDTIDQAKAAAQADYEARTAERFRAVELPSKWIVGGSDHIVFVSGYNQAIRDIHEAIAKATTPESLHTKL
jgi:hypothetical protein